MMKEGDLPYWDQSAFQDAIKSESDVVIIQLGTNDAKTYQWDEEAFARDYYDMLNVFSGSKVYVSIPPPLYEDGVYSMDQQVINERFPELIREIAANSSVVTGIVDIFTVMGGADLANYELFCDLQSCDKCHPTDLGYARMATVMYKAVFM